MATKRKFTEKEIESFIRAGKAHLFCKCVCYVYYKSGNNSYGEKHQLFFMPKVNSTTAEKILRERFSKSIGFINLCITYCDLNYNDYSS